MAKLIRLTHDRLLETLDYDPATGIFTWKVARSNRVKIGARAGVFHQPSGGRYISIDGEKFMAHRLAWFFVRGAWPASELRPIDGNYDNCALANLREATRIELAHARGRVTTNTSGYNGVSKAQRGKWQAKITWNYKQIGLGANFETAEDASAAVEAATEIMKTSTSEEKLRAAISAMALERRQRAVWSNLLRNNEPHVWADFSAFSLDVVDIPKFRYALAPVDAAKPIGPGNYRWATIGNESSSSQDRVAYNRANREANRDHYRGKDFRKKYGIDFGTYQKMLVDQKGVCAICEKPETKLQHGSIRLLSVDHDHTTGAVRSLLCGNCNMGIGYLCDDPAILRKAIAYLEKFSLPNNVVRFEPAVIGGALGAGA